MHESTELFNVEDMKSTLKFISREMGAIELRILECGSNKLTGVGFFTDHEALIHNAAQWSGNSKGVYVTLNPVHPDLLKRANNSVKFNIASTRDTDIMSRQLLPLDFDPVRPTGQSSTEEELQRALVLADRVMNELAAQGFPKPVVANSGNGAHLLYRIDLPNDGKSHQLIKTFHRVISRKYSTKEVHVDTSISNASRIFKLYGTMAGKGASTPERPHRISHLVSFPDELIVVTEEQLEHIIVTLEDLQTSTHKVNGEVGHLPNADLILKGCGWFRNCVENAAETPEPDWYAMLSIAGRCENGETLAHEFSRDHPGYSRSRTNEKLKHALDSAGPRTCEHIATISKTNFCEHCKFSGKITSPISLGDRGPGLMARENYFTEKGKFIPAALGKDIMQTLPMFYDGQHMYAYESGVYKRNGRERVQQLSQKVLGWSSKKNLIEETIYWLKNEVLRSSDSLNQDDSLINVSNGLLDWRTGQLLPHTPERLSTIQIPVVYDPNATCPAIERFISEVVPAGVVPLIYEIAGYLLRPTTKFEKAFMFTGQGANGKSTLIRVLTALVGLGSTTNIPLQDLETNRFKAAQLQGKLLNTFADLPPNVMEKSSLFKAIVSGDRISAEFKGQDSFDFTPFCRLLFSANELPTSKDVSTAFFRRWIIVPFPYSFEGKKDHELAHRLLSPENLSGFLNLALDGLRRLEKNKEFTLDESTRLGLQQYQRDADSVVSFVEECCELVPSSAVWKSKLYRAYSFWCKETGLKPLGKPRFTKRLREHCPDLGESREFCTYGKVRLWTGIRLDYMFPDFDTDLLTYNRPIKTTEKPGPLAPNGPTAQSP